MIENLWILKYKVMVMLNICNLIKLKPISKNPQRFTTRVTSNDVQSATKLVLPGDLAEHAVAEGTRALNKFGSAA